MAGANGLAGNLVEQAVGALYDGVKEWSILDL